MGSRSAGRRPWSFERYPYFQTCLSTSASFSAPAGTRPAFLHLIEPVIESTQLNVITDPMLEVADSVGHADEANTAVQIDRNGGLERPFLDAGPTPPLRLERLGKRLDRRDPE